LLRLKCCSSDPVEALAAFFAERGSPAIGLAALRTDCFKPPAARVTESRIKRILTLTLRTNHNENQSRLDRIILNSIKPELRVHSEGSKAGYSPRLCEKQVKGCYNQFTSASSAKSAKLYLTGNAPVGERSQTSRRRVGARTTVISN
jgi:hypothetical protein